ncbi:alcohol oxidase [Artomyces pyxidatus]|uniref:Alcohol oxidase n=1 Tax=Artomyces pyxidatus TaxID=48021 RepID=A0ACB8TEV6_9AGAM|nr:alcohol oxidase [Artomyces pyxidatus]
MTLPNVRSLLILPLPLLFLLAPHLPLVYGSSASSNLTPAEFAAKPFDVIVVGGGNAGLVLANRLSAPPSTLRVGLIEAGADYPVDDLIDTPTAGNLLGNARVGTLLGNPTYDWELQSVPQPALDGQPLQYPRGKVMGGSTAINSMVWQRGSRADYDAWASQFGNGPEWGFDALLPYFARSESWHPPSPSAPPLFPDTSINFTALGEMHGTEGPIEVSYNSWLTDLDAPAAQAAVAAARLQPNTNPDGGHDASMPATGTARTVGPVSGQRSYAASAYLSADVRARSNLEVVTEAAVSRILWDVSGNVTNAKAVEFVSAGKTYTVDVRKEVVLAAGALKTPQILELSGVGNRTLLESLDIPVVLDLPEVGENLQDHPVTLSDFRVVPNVVTLDTLGYNATFRAEQAELYKSSRTGALSYTSAPLGPVPLQSMTTPAQLSKMRAQLESYIASADLTPMQKVQYDVLRDIVDKGEDGWVEMVVVPAGGVLSAPEEGRSYLTAVAIQLHPFGRGSVHIKSTDPSESPAIDPRFLEIPWDFDVLVHGAKFIRKWISTDPIAPYIDKLVTPPASLTGHAEWEKFVHGNVRTTNHPLGTTAMAPRSLGGVVDPSLKIYGLKNVRVVDAGVIPLTIGVAIMPTVYAVAEKAADILWKEWKLDLVVQENHLRDEL